MASRNLELLIVAAKLLRPVLDELVFLGGCATGLLVSDEAAAEVRPTFDVDAIAEITSYVDLEDLITIVDGRPELLDELRLASEDVRSYIAGAIGQMLKARQFIDAPAICCQTRPAKPELASYMRN
jgi:hypothetical protein